MAINEMIWQGFELMMMGVASVFIFLSILVVLMQIMSRLGATFGAAEESLPQAPAPVASAATAASSNTHLLPVISAAISRFRADHKA